MKIKFNTRATYQGKKVNLKNVITFDKNNSTFSHKVEFMENTIYHKIGLANNNLSFRWLLLCCSVRSSIYFERLLKQDL